jgi:hypothetical protein
MRTALLRKKIVSILAIAATAVGALLVVAAPAQADIRRNCFGYIGNFKSDTRMEYADWNADGETDECFGIAPDRTIWHAWQNSGGWWEMPNGGLADRVVESYASVSGDRVVIVGVAGVGQFYSRLQVGRGSWQAWTFCPAGCLA